MTIEELRARLVEVEARLAAIHEDAGETRSLTTDETAEWDALASERATLATDIEAREARAALAATIVPAKGSFTAPNVIIPQATPDEVDLRTATPGEVRDLALAHIERKVNGHGPVSREDAQENAERIVRSVSGADRHVVAYGGATYESAFSKTMTGRANDLLPEERAALASESASAGGYLVPTHLDPTVILTNSGISHPYRNISKTVTLGPGQDNSWQGVSSAGVTFSWDAELAEVSDDSPTFAQPTINVEKMQGFVQASNEAITDIAGLESLIMPLIYDGIDRLEGAAFSTGSGSGQPYGIFTALDANTNVELSNTTAATLGAVDLYAAYKFPGIRFRSNASWVSHVLVQNTVRQLGTVDANFTVNIMAGGIPELFGRPYYEDTSAPQGHVFTTAVENWLVFGDFSNYVIVDKIGTRMQYIPFLLNTSNNLPDDRVGWHVTKRLGADSVNDVAFVLLQDKTSA